MDRRAFLQVTGTIAAGVSISSLTGCATSGSANKPWFDISLAEWSLHRNLRADKLTHLDFPKVAKNEFGIYAVEYEGGKLDEYAGIRATKTLLETVRAEMS